MTRTRTVQGFTSTGDTRRPNTRVGVRNEDELLRHTIAALKAGESVIITNGFPETRWAGGGQSAPARMVHDVVEFCEQGYDVATLAENKCGITPEELAAQFLNEVFYATTGAVIPLELRVKKGLPVFDPAIAVPDKSAVPFDQRPLESRGDTVARIVDLAERVAVHLKVETLEAIRDLDPRERQIFARELAAAANDRREWLRLPLNERPGGLFDPQPKKSSEEA